MPRVNRLPRAIWLAETALFEWSCSLVQFCSTPATNLRHKWAVPFFFVCKNPATENDISLSDLRPAIAATSTVACSAARVGCERLTVESLRELRGSSFCSLRTSGRRRATGRRPALRQYLPWAVPHPGTNRAPRRRTSEASWSLALPSRVQARMLVCFAAPFSLAPHSWVCVLEQTHAGLCPRARSLPARASENIKRTPGLGRWRGSEAPSVRERVKFSWRRAPRAKLLSATGDCRYERRGLFGRARRLRAAHG